MFCHPQVCCLEVLCENFRQACTICQKSLFLTRWFETPKVGSLAWDLALWEKLDKLVICS